MTTETITETETDLDAPAKPSETPLAEETLAGHPEWKHIFDGWGDESLFPPPRYLPDCELYTSHGEFIEENERAEKIDKALYWSLYQGALQRVQDSSTWVVDGTHAMPRAALEPVCPDDDETGHCMACRASQGEPHRPGCAFTAEPGPAADEAQAGATDMLKRWGADPAATVVMHATVLEPLPEDEA